MPKRKRQKFPTPKPSQPIQEQPALAPAPPPQADRIFDLLKHMSTLSAAAAALTATILKSEMQGWRLSCARLALICFVGALALALSLMVDSTRYPFFRDANQPMSRIRYVFTVVLFFVAVIALMLGFLGPFSGETR
jgi:hypothetical protein